MTTTHSGAKFKIETSPSTDGGFDAAANATIAAQLEASPALDVSTCQYSIPIRTRGAPAPTLANGGVAEPPTAPVNITLGEGSHAYVLKCQTNGGEAVPGPDGKPDRSINTTYRIIKVRTTVAGLCKIVVGETLQYDTIEGWVGAFNELVDAVEDIAVAQANGAAWSVVGPKTDNYTAAINEFVLVDMSASPLGRTITLPLANTQNKGRRVAFADITPSHMGTMQVTTQGSQKILPNDVETIAGGGVGFQMVLVSTGTGWVIEP